MNFVNDIVEAKLLSLHTVFLAKVLSVANNKATIQPLNMIKQVGKEAQKQAPIPNVPITIQAKGKAGTDTIRYVKGVSLDVDKTTESVLQGDGTTKSFTYVSNVTQNVSYAEKEMAVLSPISKGDIVVCACSERDITEAKNGKIAVPANRHHSLSDTIIIGVL